MRATVGIFDSGVGGLSVAEALHRLAPALPIHYLADTAFFPYGDRTAEEIRERTVEMVRRLIDEGHAAGCAIEAGGGGSAGEGGAQFLRGRTGGAGTALPFQGRGQCLQVTGRSAGIKGQATVRAALLEQIDQRLKEGWRFITTSSGTSAR